MIGKILRIADGVLPEAALPDPALAGATALCGIGGGAREALFDQPPARREIMIAFGQRPDAMEMIGQDAHGDGFERPVGGGASPRGAQMVDMVSQQARAPIRHVHREETCPARNIKPSIIRHIRSPKPDTVGCIEKRNAPQRKGVGWFGLGVLSSKAECITTAPVESWCTAE